MPVSETLVPPDEKADLAAMMQDYLADMALLIPGVTVDQGYPGLDLYWLEPNVRWPFWLNADAARVGFALLEREGPEMQIEEFFVARSHRRRGVGLGAARRLIARFPGAWRITQRESNQPAIAFWHRVLDGLVDYDETITSTDAVRREQRFTYP